MHEGFYSLVFFPLNSVRIQTKVIKRDIFKVLRGECPSLAAESLHHRCHDDLVSQVDLVVVARSDGRLHPPLHLWPDVAVVLLDGVEETRRTEAAAVKPARRAGVAVGNVARLQNV